MYQWFFFSCEKKDLYDRTGILTPDQMTNALIQVHLCEAKVGHSFYSGDSSKLYYASLEKEAFSKLGITNVQYAQSHAFYTAHLVEFDDIYTRVVDSLSLRQQLKKYY